MKCGTCAIWRVLGTHDGISGAANTGKKKYGKCGLEGVKGCIKWEDTGACPLHKEKEAEA